jgi:ABC-2 type transport system permease protein
MEQAEQLLTDGDADGIFRADGGGQISLTVLRRGLNQSVLKTISDRYRQISSTMNNIAQTRPDLIEQTIETLSGGIEIEINREIYLGRGETDMMLNFFYALLAMTCLYGSFFGHAKIAGIQANLSPLAARRSVSPSKKISMILSDFTASVTVLFVESLIVIAYLVFVLGINFGEQWLLVIFTTFIGSIMGVSLGIFIASFVKGSESTVAGVLSGLVLVLCFFSGLMYGNMKNVIEQRIPVINRINPAAVLSDAYYALVVYDTHSRYIICIITMLIISTIFCIAAAFVLGRKKYASI